MNGANPSTIAPIDSLEAYESVRTEIEAVASTELVRVNVDVLGAVTKVLGALPQLRQLRERLVELEGFDIASFDRLESYARALGHAHTLHLRTKPSLEVAEIAARAVALRETLLVDATALAHRGIIDKTALKGLKGAVGYRNIAFDLGALSNLIRQRWESVQGNSAVRESELYLARTLADRLLTAVGQRRFEAPAQSEVSLTRRRVFTLFVRAYDQVRRAVSYLRWNEGDVNEIAPSLYERRSKRKGTATPKPGDESQGEVELTAAQGHLQHSVRRHRSQPKARAEADAALGATQVRVRSSALAVAPVVQLSGEQGEQSNPSV